MRKCSTCGKLLIMDIKYHTADGQYVFCDAYCSHDWYSKQKETNGEEDEK
jgi:hypothetical protein